MTLADLMKKNPITAKPTDSLNTAGKLFKENSIRHLPILNDEGELVGIVTDRDLKQASASEATSLEIHELMYLLSKIKLEQVMTANLVTAMPETPVESGAGLMVDHKIGCLPVVRRKKLVGIVTKRDFLAFLAGSHSVRASA